MTTSRSFDRAAGYYDQTRPLPDSIAQDGIQAILNLVRPGARLLEVGAGTGRISIPLLERGVDLIGCDLSANMLKRLQGKSPAARIVQADASQLPFPVANFDAVMTVHVLHLVSTWREALREFRRVVTPGGVYLNAKTWAPAGVSTREQIRLHWRGWMAKHGVEVRHPGIQDQEDLLQELQSMGAQWREVEVTRYSIQFTLREDLERFATRIYSETWDLPDDLFDASMHEVRTWAEAEFGDLDQALEDQLRFAIDVVRF